MGYLQGKSVFESEGPGLTLVTDLVLITAAPPNKRKEGSKEKSFRKSHGFPLSRAFDEITGQALHVSMSRLRMISFVISIII